MDGSEAGMKRMSWLWIIFFVLLPKFTAGNDIMADPYIDRVVQKSGSACIVFSEGVMAGWSSVRLVRIIDQVETVLFDSDEGAFDGLTKQTDAMTFYIYADTCVAPGDVFYKMYGEYGGEEMKLASKMITIKATEDPCDDTAEVCADAADYLDGDEEDDDEAGCGCM